MRYRSALRSRYGRSRGSHGSLRWDRLPDGKGVHAITARGMIYAVLHDRHKRKWVLIDGDQRPLGSATRQQDAKRIAQQIEDKRS